MASHVKIRSVQFPADAIVAPSQATTIRQGAPAIIRPIGRPSTETHLLIRLFNNIKESKVKRFVFKISISTVIVSLCLNLFLSTLTAGLGFTNQSLIDQRAEVSSEIDSINLKLVRKSSPSSLLKYAKLFSMLPAKNVSYIDVKAKKILKDKNFKKKH